MKHIHDEEPPLVPTLMASLRDPVPSRALQERTLRALGEDGVLGGRAVAEAAPRRAVSEAHGRGRGYLVRAIAASLIFAAGLGLGSWHAGRGTLIGSPIDGQGSGAPTTPSAARIQDAAQSYVDALALADSGAARLAALASFRMVIEQMTRIVPAGQPGGAAFYAVSNANQPSPGQQAHSGGLLWY